MRGDVKISEVRQKLAEIQEREGDLPCMVYNCEDAGYQEAIPISEIVIRPGDDLSKREPTVLIA